MVTIKQNILSALSTIMLVVGFSMLAYTLFPVMKDLSENEVSLKYLVLPIAISSFFLVVFSSLSWGGVLEGVTGEKVRFNHAVIQTGMVLVGKYIPGKIWGVAFKIFLAESFGLSRKKVLTASLVELPLGLICSFLIGAHLMLLSCSVELVFASSILFLLLFKVCKNFHFFTFFSISNLDVVKKIEDKYQFSSMSISISNALLLRYGVLAAIQWFFVGIVVVSIMDNLVVSGGSGDIAFIVGAYIMSVIVGFVAFFSPGGIVVRESVFVILISHKVGVAEASQLAAMLRTWNVIYDFVFATISACLIFYERYKE